MNAKKYFEECGAPSDERLIATVFAKLKGKDFTPEIEDILSQLLALDKKSLGRYLAKRDGYKFKETVAEIKEDAETGDLYENLLIDLDTEAW